MQKTTQPNPSLPAGTRVIHTNDGEVGVVMNGFSFDALSGEWTEYEIETRRGIERWARQDFILMSEAEGGER